MNFFQCGLEGAIVTVRFAGIPRERIGSDSIKIEAATVRELLSKLGEKLGDPWAAMGAGESEYDTSVTILVCGRNIRFINGLETSLDDLGEDDEVYMMSQLAGGQEYCHGSG